MAALPKTSPKRSILRKTSAGEIVQKPGVASFSTMEYKEHSEHATSAIFRTVNLGTSLNLSEVLLLTSRACSKDLMEQSM